MIHIFIGTKAQYIKMAPLIETLVKRRLKFNLIDTGQHAKITSRLRKELNLGQPIFFMYGNNSIDTLTSAFIWTIKYFLLGIFKPGWLKKRIFLGQKGICIIHGDTLSTLVSLFLAKRTGLTVAHIEAGLRSFSYFDPFPEELIRIIAMRFSDLLFAPSDWAYNNLKQLKSKAEIFRLSANTNLEAVKNALEKVPQNLSVNSDKYCLVSIHRLGNILSFFRLRFITNLLIKLGLTIPVVFVQHPATIIQLRRFRQLSRLQNSSNIHIYSLLSHTQFIHTLKDAQFVITDGGSVQEESFYLGIPCLLMRMHTERKEGIGKNVLLSEFDSEKINYFLNHYSDFKIKPNLDSVSPSDEIVKAIRNYA
jgi:UDP-N-acetylglucosamine 2-epimerase